MTSDQTPSLFNSFRKYIEVNVIDEEEYEKDVNFFIEIGEPRLIRLGKYFTLLLKRILCDRQWKPALYWDFTS